MNGANTVTKFLFDLDGTLTKVETLPLIAKTFHVKGIEGLTRETILGRIPFEESLARRVSMLRDLPVDEVALLLGNVEVYPLLAEFIRKYRESCCLVTGNLSCWIALLTKKLGCTCYASEAEVADNRIKKLTRILRKEEIVRGFQEEGHRVVMIGDGNNDVDAMHLADHSVAVGLTHAPAKSVLAVANHVFFDEKALCGYLESLL